MSSSREESPDWLHSYQPPTQSVVTLSSDSDLSERDQPLLDQNIGDYEKPSRREYSISPDENETNTTPYHNEGQSSILKASEVSPKKESGESRVYTKKRKANIEKKEGKAGAEQIIKKETTKLHNKNNTTKELAWALSWDSESAPTTSTKIKDAMEKEDTLANTDFSVPNNAGSISKDVLRNKPPKQRTKADRTSKEEEVTHSNSMMQGEEATVKVPEDGVTESQTEPLVCSTMMPLVLPEKVQRSKVLVECDGESIDMSGDLGAVGRVMISDAPSGHEMYLDLKGTIYKTTIVPSRTFCIVNFGQSEAKIEAIMNDFIQLKPQSNVFLSETMVEGTLDGFSFDSEDERDNVPKSSTCNDENKDSEQVNRKRKAKPEKNVEQPKKKAKTTSAKAPQKVKKKNQAQKKASNKK